MAVPAEELARGPRGYRVHVADYDASTGIQYMPLEYEPVKGDLYDDPFKKPLDENDNDEILLSDPRFHAQNVYAIAMRILARFEYALGRRVSWGFDGHQIHIAPHAFAEANAFYSETDRALMFGYFPGRRGKTIFTCLSHDVVAHETAHALLDGLRTRYTDPSSPEQAGFHEGFADVVALLSIFSLPEVIGTLLSSKPAKGAKATRSTNLISPQDVDIESLRRSVLFGLAEQMGRELSGVRGGALRQSVKLKPSTDYINDEEFEEPHRRGEILVAAIMNSFLQVWINRIKPLGKVAQGKLDLQRVVEEGAAAAEHLLTMSIRALDYAPPTDLQFCDFLSALITADREVVPDDTKYHYRQLLLDTFKSYGIEPTSHEQTGAWEPPKGNLLYDRTHFEAMLRDPDEVFRFIWENRETLGIEDNAYTRVQSVRPCLRIGPDGFAIKETVADYIQMITLRAGELNALQIDCPDRMPSSQEVTLYGGGALIFDEYGRLKYHIRNKIFNAERQTPRLKFLWKYGYFNHKAFTNQVFARMHLQRATGLQLQPPEDY